MWNSVIMEKQLPDSDFLDANIDATQFSFQFLPFSSSERLIFEII